RGWRLCATHLLRLERVARRGVSATLRERLFGGVRKASTHPTDYFAASCSSFIASSRPSFTLAQLSAEASLTSASFFSTASRFSVILLIWSCSFCFWSPVAVEACFLRSSIFLSNSSSFGLTALTS